MTNTGSIDLNPGYDHIIDAQKEGYISTPQKVTVAAGETKEITIPMKMAGTSPTEKTGTFTKVSNPPGASVGLDSGTNTIGTTPTGPVEASSEPHDL